MRHFLRLCFIAFCVLPLAFGARAQVPQLDTNLWVTDGPVYEVAKSGNTIYMAGNFTYVGPRTGCGIVVDAVTGKLTSPSKTRINGLVFAAIPDQQGGWYIGGTFNQVGAVRRNGLAHLLPDGSLDENWNPKLTSFNADPLIHALCLSGNVLYFSGIFDQVEDEYRSNLAAVDVTSGRPTPWAPFLFDGYTHGIAVHNNLVYLAGSFNQVHGEQRQGLAALDATTGDVSSWNPGANGEVRASLLAGNQLFISGHFTSVGGQTRNRLASFDLTTGELTAWQPNPDGFVNALALHDGLLYVGGGFSSIAGVSRSVLAAFDTKSMQVTPWTPRLPESESTLGITALSIVGDVVYMVGGFGLPDNKGRHASAVLATTGEVIGWDPKVGATPTVIVAGLNGSLFIGGNFTSAGGGYSTGLAAFDATTGAATPWAPAVARIVTALLATPEVVYVGGNLTTANGRSSNHLVAIDARSGQPTPWNPQVDGQVNSIAATQNRIYINGRFTSVNGQRRMGFAALDRITGQLTDWNPNPTGAELSEYAPTKLVVSGNTVFGIGNFKLGDGNAWTSYVAIDAATGELSDWNLRPDGRITGIVPYGNRLYVSGTFTKLGDKDRQYLAAVDATTREVTDWNHTLTREARALGIINNKLYVSGGQPRRNEREWPLAAVDAVSGASTYFGFTPDMNSGQSFSTAGDRIFALGQFTGVDREGYVFSPWVANLMANGSQTSTITGHVFDDRNKNCIQDKDEKGLENVTVEVKPGDYRALTNAQGYYAIAVDTGSYSVRQLLPVLKDTVAKQICPATDSHLLRVAAYGISTELNFANQLTAAYNLIKGNVFREKIEDCTRMFGELGLENIKVVAEPTGAFAFTDKEGNYTIRVDTGTYQIRQVFPVRTDSLLQTVCPAAEHPPVRFSSLGNTATRDFANRLIARYNLIEGQIVLGGSNGGDCGTDPAPKPLAGIKVMAEPGPYYGISDSTGHYVIRVDTGFYQVKQIPGVHNGFGTIDLCPSGPSSYEVSFKTYNNTVTGKNFRDQVTRRAHLTASVTSTRRRRCFSSTTTLAYCNLGNAAATDAKVHLQLPLHVVLISADAAYTRDKDGHYVFSLGSLAARECGSIQVQDSVVCNDPNIRGLTQCTKVWITPANGTTPAPEWDRSDITLKARCLTNGVVRLGVYNTGSGPMADSAAYRILLDAGLALQGKYKLAAGDSLVLRVPANGRTVRLEADQRPGHPTKQSASVTLEACGTNASGGVSLGFVAQLPADDAEPEVAEECLPITDSFDPNDKLVRPAGVTAEHYTPTGAALSYTVRFQNTGNDYAYKVVVVDTLAAELDLSTLQMGAVSHPYKFTVSGKGRPVLAWTFDNIMLPDSTRDQAGSNGFIQFSIKPLADLPAKALVENFADIFFDYNPPIRTNTVFNRIYDVPPVVAAADRLEAAVVIATPVITGFTPTAGAAGTVVTLTGLRFDPVPARNRVTFNGIAATVTAATATSLTVTVPPGEVAGRIGVTTADGAARSATDFSLVVPPPTAIAPGLPAGPVRIYPNPAPGRFVVEFASPAAGVTEIVTLDARGGRVHTLSLAGKPATRAEIDLTGHPAGMYLVLIRTDRGITTRKVTLRP